MATVVLRKTSNHKKHRSTKQLLRRPIPPAPPPEPKHKVTISSRPPPPPAREPSPQQPRCVPSAASLRSQEDLQGYVSPVPSFESEIQTQLSGRHPTPTNTPWSPLKHNLSKVHPSPVDAPSPDMKFILESRYKITKERPQTFEPKSLVKPIKPKGPDCFPIREPRRLPDIRHEFLYMDADDPRYHQDPEFTLDDFTIDPRDVKRTYPRNRLKEAVLSKQNFNKMTTLFASFVDKPLQEKVHTVQLRGEDIPEVIPRVPQQQLLLEMAYIIRSQMREMAHDEILSLMPPPENELLAIMAAAQQTGQAGSQSVQQEEGGQQSIMDPSLFGVPANKFFQGARRSNSPFSEVDSSNTISPSELAILDCLVNGGLALSLKAHFIGSMPEISPLIKTLTYLNLSFNDFTAIPQEVLTLKNLRVLKLRNNPLKQIPHDISKLKKLKTLVVSFCMVSKLPVGLFKLPLQFLDLSYNKLTVLPNEIKHLKSLRALNVEGNQLTSMPCSALKMRSLRYLRVYNNFMHPLFWKENAHNEPQRLTDLAAVSFSQYELEERYQVPTDVSKLLQSYTTCDCCGGSVYGRGLRVIRPCSQAFGVKKLPFLFISCSPQCRDWFMESVESLTSILYEEEGNSGGGEK